MYHDHYPYQPKCDKCSVDMERQPYKRPYITPGGISLGSILEVYICPCCGAEKELLQNDEDGYSAGSGLFSED